MHEVPAVPIARVALPVRAQSAFDYWIPEGLAVGPGSMVRVKLGPRRLVGVVTDLASETDVAPEKLQPIQDIVSGAPLAGDVLDLGAFVAAYYQEPIGLALALAVPPTAGERKLRTQAPDANRLTDEGHLALPGRLARAPSALNCAQLAAVQAIAAADAGFAVFLLHGVTGSGKTDVYLATADAVFARGQQVLMLAPEINLTPQLLDRVREARPDLRIATLHSGLGDSERRAQWEAAASGAAQLVLGTRLAVFTALPALGLVIVDEEHDLSYKQQDNVRYHARDAAVWRARRRNVPVVLGSATPSLESWLHAREGRYRRLDLPQRADPRAAMPRVSFAANRSARSSDGVGATLRAAIAARLSRGEQSLIFVNRRGYAPSLVCAACGWEAQCPRCSVRLTTHRVPPSLRCHHCGHGERLARACPECGNVDLTPLGYGTQRLERCLADAFPQARIARVDRDSTRAKNAFASVRERMNANELDILIGTQMLAKGHDFPRLTLVGVLGADNALYSADFRATERLAALLMQVTGRAGRAQLPGEVIVQTDFPAHPVYTALAAHDYARFADLLLAERKDAQLPPFAHVALLAAEAHDRSDVDAFLGAAHAAAAALVASAHPAVIVFSPVPALLQRRAGLERGQMVVQSARRVALQRFLPEWRAALDSLPGRRARWGLDVDPAGFG
ncbi:MAG: primosomal protein N' [Burkholderiales bacterium]|nr:primosomal protein N' [Burkholderiales bacterium]